MKKLFLALALLALSPSCATSKKARGPVTPEQERFESSLMSLVRESMQSEPACQKYSSQAQSLLADVNTDSDFVAKNANAFKRIKPMLGRYPGAPKAHFQAVKMVLSELPPESYWNGSAIFTSNPCSFIRFYELARTVLASADAYKMPAQERISTGKIILGKIRKDMAGPQISLPVFGSIYLARSVAKNGFAPLNAESLERLLTDSESVRVEIAKKNKKLSAEDADSEKNEVLVFEFQEVEKLRKRLLAELNSN